MDCCDLSLFQLSLIGQEGGGRFKYAQCHFFAGFLWHWSLSDYRSTLDMCLEVNSSWSMICGAEEVNTHTHLLLGQLQ